MNNCIVYSCEFCITVFATAGMRIDQAIILLNRMSRSQLKARIIAVYQNEKEVKLSKKCYAFDCIHFTYYAETQHIVHPVAMSLDIIYQNRDVLLINKPRGLVVHPGAGTTEPTLVHGLVYYLHDLAGEFSHIPERPGIVHRLDKDTSGIMIIARHVSAHAFIAQQFHDRCICKYYLALVYVHEQARLRSYGEIRTHIARDPKNRKRYYACSHSGKFAHTAYHVIVQNGKYALLLLRPHTGRTHQLRVHLQSIYCPIVGDPVYGARHVQTCVAHAPLALHAWSLEVELPHSGTVVRHTAPIPHDFIETCKSIGIDVCTFVNTMKYTI